jgi:hypothetical protein
MSELFPDMKRIFKKPVKHGKASIDHRTVTKLESVMSAWDIDAYCRPGTYCRLIVDGRLWMSDTQMEHRTNYEVVREARGNVLIAGLGIGMILQPILKKPEVKRVIVIEKYTDVITLVKPTLKSKKVALVEGDIYEWLPEKGTKFDAIYFDIWAEQSTDCLKEMTKLHRRFRPFMAKDGWINSWRRDELRAQKRRDSRQYGW